MTETISHPKVIHPLEELARKEQNRFVQWNDRVSEYMANKVLASLIMFDLAVVLPLLVLPMPMWAKTILAVISSNWIQWWGLPSIQRSNVKADKSREAKYNADHAAQTHIAVTSDKILEFLEGHFQGK